jgi:hypothetical protein
MSRGSSVGAEVDARLSAALARLAARASETRSQPKQPEESPASNRPLFLPGLDDFMRAMPNHIARSSLFAPVARGRKRILKDVVLVSRTDAVVKFWGEQLDEPMADVWMQALHEASKQPLGKPVLINRAQFLKAIGRQTGNYEYQWLNRAMQTLSFAMLVIEITTQGKPKLSVGKNSALHMIDGFEFDDAAGSYALRIDPRWRQLFGNAEFARIDWRKRLLFGPHQDMAKALQRLVATSKDSVQPHRVDWLKAKLEYGGRMRDFIEAINRAMRELERLEIICAGRIETSTKGHLQVVWTRL